MGERLSRVRVEGGKSDRAWSRRKKFCWLALITVVSGSNSVQSTRGPSVLIPVHHMHGYTFTKTQAEAQEGRRLSYMLAIGLGWHDAI